MRWSPVPVLTMQHILGQMVPPGPEIQELARSMAPRFLVPTPSPLHFATQQRRFGQITAILMTVSALRVLRGLGSTAGTTHVGFVLSGAVILKPIDGEPITLTAGDVCSISDWSRYEVEAAGQHARSPSAAP